jgi:glutathione S-transferase
MKLYYSPGACSLATRISLHEAGIAAEFERVDVQSKITESGHDYTAINPKGSVPMLVLDDDQAVTENVAILDLLAERAPKLGLEGPLGRTRMIEMLSFLSTELHIAFKPFFHSATDLEKAKASETASRWLDLLTEQMRGEYLLSSKFTVADAYLFAMLRWAKAFDVRMQPDMFGYSERVALRPAVRQSLAEEGLPLPSAHGEETIPSSAMASI